MSNTQLDLLKATSQRAIYEEIQFAAFHSSLDGSLRVRINPPRVVAREIVKTFQRINELREHDADAERDAELKELNERAIGYTARLIPRGADTDETLTAQELQEFLNGGDDDDAAFEVWLLRTIWEKVGAHFLAASGRAPR